MTTFAIIGAGPGLGAAVARRVAGEGVDVALVARSSAQALADDLVADGVPAHGYDADARDPAAVAGVLSTIAEDLGPIEVLQYSPAPAASSLRPVLETTVDDVAGAVEMSVHGAVAAVRTVLPGMRERGRGSVLFVNGGSAARANARVAGTSVAFAALSTYAGMLHDELRDDGVHVGQLIVPGAIEPGHPHKDPAVLADSLWAMHRDRDGFRRFAAPLDPGSPA